MVITPELKAKLAERFGVNAEEVFSVACDAAIVPLSADAALDPAEATLVARYNKKADTAGGPPAISDGVPTLIRVVAWMCHEGINNNRLKFIKEELPVAASKIAAPNFIVMDWNHSAVFQYPGDQRIIGIWYKADYAFDPKAKQGAGAWGILTTGIMFAWANPEIANAMLAEQERNGKLNFSMACLSGSSEYGRDDDGPFVVAHNPIFFTNSALDVTPADLDSIGQGKEGSENPSFETDTTKSMTSLTATESPDEVTPAPNSNNELQQVAAEEMAIASARLTEESQMDELKEKLEAALAKLSTSETSVADLTAKLEAALGTKSELEVAQTALETAHTTAIEAKDAEIATLTEKLTAAETRLAEIDAKAAEVAAAEKLAARIAKLPEAVRTTYEKASADEKTALEKRWASKSDEDFEQYLTVDLAVFSTAAFKGRTGYVDRSQKEGLLPNSAGSQSDLSTRAKALLK